jgi:hypothetical protein
MLAVLNPGFSDAWVKEWHVFRTPHAQPVFTTNFADLMPAHRTPVRGLYVTDSTQFYPEDRTISAAIKQGRTVAAMIIASRCVPRPEGSHGSRRGSVCGSGSRWEKWMSSRGRGRQEQPLHPARRRRGPRAFFAPCPHNSQATLGNIQAGSMRGRQRRGLLMQVRRDLCPP